MQTITIPKKCKAGFQTRNDTYSGKLAYVIYYDEKGVLRKETSWKNWRSEKLEALDFDNIPTKGFFINRNIGGYRSGWDYRQSYCRVYDPRGFEIEIKISNLIYILKNVSSLKEKGLDGEFVYGWDKTDLVLVPVEAPEYQQIKQNTTAVYEQGNIGAKDLVIGHTYANLEGHEFVYLANDYKYSYFPVCLNSYPGKEEYTIKGMTREEFEKLSVSLLDPNERIQIRKSSKKCFWFYDKSENKIITFSSLDKKLYYVIENKVAIDFDNRIDQLNKMKEYSQIQFSKSKIIFYTFDDFYREVIYLKTRYQGWATSFYSRYGKRYSLFNIRGDYFNFDGFEKQDIRYDDLTMLKKVFDKIQPIKSVNYTLKSGHIVVEPIRNR